MIPRHLLCSLHCHSVSETRAQTLHSFHHNLSPASLLPHMASWTTAVAVLEPGGLGTDSSFGMGSPRDDIMHCTWGNLIFISICISDIDPYPGQSASHCRSETLLQYHYNEVIQTQVAVEQSPLKISCSFHHMATQIHSMLLRAES